MMGHGIVNMKQKLVSTMLLGFFLFLKFFLEMFGVNM